MAVVAVVTKYEKREIIKFENITTVYSKNKIFLFLPHLYKYFVICTLIVNKTLNTSIISNVRYFNSTLYCS